MNFGEELKRVCLSFGFDKDDMAIKLGLPHQNIHRDFKKVDLSTKRLKRYAKALGISDLDLFLAICKVK